MKSLALALVLALVARTAHAEDPERAEAYFRAGEQAYRAQSFAAAAQDFEEAYRSLPLPEIAFSAAQAYRRQYRIDPRPEYVTRAVELYRAYLDKVKSGGRVADAADGLNDMQRELDTLIKAGAKVTPKLAAEHTQLGIDVTLGTRRSGATMREIDDRVPAESSAVAVTIDGNKVEPYALVNVEPGKHAVHAEAPGYFPTDRDVVAVQGTAQMVELALSAKPARVAITTSAGARIEIDGRPIASAPRDALELPSGHHLIAITERGHEPFVRELALGNDEHITLHAPLVPTARRRAVPWVLGGATVLALTSMTTTTLAYLAERDAIEIRDRARATGNLDPSVIPAYRDDRDRRDRYVTVSVIAGAAALTAVTAGLALYWFDDPRVAAAPMLTDGGGGAAVLGRF